MTILSNGKEVYGIIYKITNKINGKIYIGQTIQDGGFDARYNGDLEKNTHNDYLRNSIEKYGIGNFQIEKEFDYAIDKEELDSKEIYYIKLYDCMNRKRGYNIREGGSNGKHSEESKKKMSKAQSGKKLSKEHKNKLSKAFGGENNPMYGKKGEDNPNFGRKHTEEELRKMSEARIGENHPMYGRVGEDNPNFIDRTGEIRRSNEGYEMKIVEYKNCHDIWIEFQDEHKAKIHTSYDHFDKGKIKNPYHPLASGIGYIGVGEYSNKNDKHMYQRWWRLCKKESEGEKVTTYKDIILPEEWHNLQIFAKWYYKKIENGDINRGVNRVGEIRVSNEGCEMKIVEYKKEKNIIVEFQDEHKARVHTSYSAFKNGGVRNLYHRSICGVGYIGEGKYNKKNEGKAYNAFKYICKKVSEGKEVIAYKEHTLPNEWYNFQVFAEWYYEIFN